MPRPVIVVDIDDVLAIENDAVRLFMNKRYGLNHTPEDYLVDATYWGYWDTVMGINAEEGARRLDAYLDSDEKAKLKVMPGALNAITALKLRYELAIVTSRQDKAIDATHDWLERHFPEVFKRVEFVTLWSADHKASKAVICDQIGASYLVDDNAEHCLEAAEMGITSLLFGDYGWNRRAELPNNVKRVKDWPAVLEYFDGQH